MSNIEVGDAPMRYVNVKSSSRCPKCGNYMTEKIPAPRKGQFRYESNKGRSYMAHRFCSSCGYGR